jgi:hypothetical protein
MKIVAYRCPDCAIEIYSRCEHDFRKCDCGYIAVDGGHFDTQTGRWICKRMVHQPNKIPLTNLYDISVTLKDLYNDWNNGDDKYGKVQNSKPTGNLVDYEEIDREFERGDFDFEE